MARLLAVVLVIVAILTAGSIIMRKESPSAAPETATSTSTAPQGHAEVFAKMSYSEAVKAAGSRVLLVDATASWCPPCKQMEKDTWTSHEVAAWVKARGLAVQVDVDQDRPAAGLLSIQAMPTVILFKDGKELARNVGYMDASMLLSWLNQHAG